MLLALSIAQKFSTGSITFIIGIVMTFSVLTVLIICVMLLDYFLNQADFKKLFRKKDKDAPIANVEPQKEIVQEEAINAETLDAINAAIKEYMMKSSDVPHTRYTVRTVKKIIREDA